MIKRISIYLKHNLFYLIALFVIITLNLIFSQLPLVSLLSYESSALNGVLISLIGGLYWLYCNKKGNTKYYHTSIFILIPFIILIFSTLFCSSCPIDNGIYFFLILTIPSLFIGITLASFAIYISPKLKLFVFIFIWLILIFGFLPELYFNPQVYFYNPIFGYYPGVIYDQNIEITSNLIAYRLSNLIVCMLILLLINRDKHLGKKNKLIVISIVTLSVLMFYINKSRFGFATDIDTIKNELGAELNTEHFHIIYPDTLDQTSIDLLKYEHEYYYYSISKQLNKELGDKITSIVFESGAQKKKLFGSENADVAKTWLGQIYLNYNNYDKTVKHEISHIFSAEFAEGMFKVPSDFNPGMIEGFAMAVENNFDDYDIDYIAALAHKYNFKVSLSNLFNGFSFFSNVSSISYIYSGSFMKFLAERFSWKKFTKVYSDGNFKKIFDYEISELEKEYYKYLNSLLIDNNTHQANYYFGRLPLFKKYCARATAKELRNTQDFLTKKKYDLAAEKFLEIYQYSNSYRALVGFVIAKKEKGDISDSIKFLLQEIEKFKNTSYYYYLEFLLADFYALKNNKENADYYYSIIIEQSPHPNYISSAKFKKDLLYLNDSTLIKYMEDWEFKDNILNKHVLNSPNDYVVQLFVRRYVEKHDEALLKLNIIKTIVANHSLSSDTYFQISKFAYKYLFFEDALHFAELSLSNSDFKRQSVIKEHILKNKWIISNYY